jgi:predicted HicB family RNase H-like nuclease
VFDILVKCQYNTSMLTKRFMIYIDPDLLERLKKAAKKDKRSMNNAIAYAIEKYVESQEKGEQKDAGQQKD